MVPSADRDRAPAGGRGARPRRPGSTVEPELTDVAVRDVLGRSGALPLLSTALAETWERRRDGTLTLAGYLATGGVTGAVARSAEDGVRVAARARRRPLARRVLVRLAEQDQEGTLRARRDAGRRARPRGRRPGARPAGRRDPGRPPAAGAGRRATSRWPTRRCSPPGPGSPPGWPTTRSVEPYAATSPRPRSSGRPTGGRTTSCPRRPPRGGSRVGGRPRLGADRAGAGVRRGRRRAAPTPSCVRPGQRAAAEAAGRRRTRRLAMVLAAALVVALVSVAVAVRLPAHGGRTGHRGARGRARWPTPTGWPRCPRPRGRSTSRCCWPSPRCETADTPATRDSLLEHPGRAPQGDRGPPALRGGHRGDRTECERPDDGDRHRRRVTPRDGVATRLLAASRTSSPRTTGGPSTSRCPPTATLSSGDQLRADPALQGLHGRRRPTATPTTPAAGRLSRATWRSPRTAGC